MGNAGSLHRCGTDFNSSCIVALRCTSCSPDFKAKFKIKKVRLIHRQIRYVALPDFFDCYCFCLFSRPYPYTSDLDADLATELYDDYTRALLGDESQPKASGEKWFIASG
jgi:hypothetical protein